MKNKMGRPKITEPGVKMEFRVTVVVNEAQAGLMKSVAAAKGKSVSAWARDVLIAALPQEVE